ncbi:UNVERIFIED_CONTAM: polysaccharide deacetylase family protein (PEP-CTERM system associated) [Acetivibrio alkalicellulosi]
MKYVYITVDIEEWYDLDYFKGINLNKNVEVIPEIIDFLDLLDEYKIKGTFFVLANVLERNSDIIREISRRGHEIACHGYDHELLYNKNLNDFKEEVLKAKALLEKCTEREIKGYRASCFSIDRDKLEILKSIGYKYDSSYIKFEHHPLYRNLDLSGYNEIEDLVFVQNDYFEYEIPTHRVFKYSVPISGGGYIRLIPYWLIKVLIKKYAKQKDNFLLYLHPFELTSKEIKLPKEINKKTKFRFEVGRKRNLKKIRKIISFLKTMGAEFRTLEYDMNERLQS